MNIEIIKYDNLGRGIGYLNNKIIFVSKALVGDILNVEITLEKKNYLEGKIIEIIKPSKDRQKAICPYFNMCGGCDFMNISLSNSLEYKLNKINDLFKRNDISYEVKEIVKSNNSYNYRNKVTLKIEDSKIGYYENNTHNLVNIDYCYLCNDVINSLIKKINLFNIINGEIVIRSNYKNEVLINIKSNDKIDNISLLVKEFNIVGIIQNDICIYGEDYFIDKINDYLFKVSYNSFFQVNPFICGKIFDMVLSYTENSKNILDLYCGVGTFSIITSNKDNYVLGVEIIENAIKDANLNKLLNKKENIDFICDDTKNILNKITNDFDTIILDPPRSGVSKGVIDKILNTNIDNIIYISCNSLTLVRDLKLLKEKYDIVSVKLFDMFSMTYHVECGCILKRKSIEKQELS